MVNFSLEGKIALITGAAHGIGFSIGRALAEAGAQITFNSSNESSLQKGLEEYDKLGINARGFVCDVKDERAVKSMVDTIKKRLER